jgi:hypothetical protein
VLNSDTGTVEITVNLIKDSLSESTKTSSVVIEFFRASKRDEMVGLMTVLIDGKKFLTDVNGKLEMHLINDKEYNIQFVGSGYFYRQQKKILIEKNREYLMKVYVKDKPEMIKD